MLRLIVLSVAALFVISDVDCSKAHGRAARAAIVATPLPATPPARAIAVETVPIANDLPAFVLRAASSPKAGRPMVFVPGMCAHPVGYVQSFQGVAAAR